MNYLGISLGTKNVKSLCREDIEEAFITSFVDSVYASVFLLTKYLDRGCVVKSFKIAFFVLNCRQIYSRAPSHVTYARAHTVYRDGLKVGPVLLSNSQARPGRSFSQPRAPPYSASL